MSSSSTRCFRVHTVSPTGWKAITADIPVDSAYTHYAILRFTASPAGSSEIETYDVTDVTSSPATDRPFANDTAYGCIRPGCTLVCEPAAGNAIGHVLAVQQP